LHSTLGSLKQSSEKDQLIKRIEHDITRLKAAERFSEINKYIGFFYEKPASLLDYLPKDGLIILDEMSRIQETATNLDLEESEWYSSLLESNQMVKDSQFSFDWPAIWSSLDHQRIYLSVFLRHIA